MCVCTCVCTCVYACTDIRMYMLHVYVYVTRVLCVCALCVCVYRSPVLEVYLMLRNLVLALWHRNCKVRKKETPTRCI